MVSTTRPSPSRCGQTAARRRPASGLAGLVVLAVLAVLALAGCGVTDIPSNARTVTVYVDPTAGGSAAPATSSVATQQAPPPSPTAIPTSLAAGRQRGAPHSYVEAQARVDSAHASGAATTAFQSPSGNIYCAIGSQGMRAACEISQGRIAPPLPQICSSGGPKDIGRIELSDKGARPICNSDTIRQPGVPKLGYGTRTDPSLGTVACVSEESGVTCVDASTRHGFFIARDTFVTF